LPFIGVSAVKWSLAHPIAATPLLDNILFQDLPRFEKLELTKFISDTQPLYAAEREGEELTVGIGQVVAQEERLVWQSFKEIFQNTLKTVAMQIEGLVTLDILTLEINAAPQIFIQHNASSLLVNHLRKLPAGASDIIRYSAFNLLVHRRTTEGRGKVEWKAPVEILNPPEMKYDLYIKRWLKQAEISDSQRCLLIINEPGKVPVFRFGEEEQTTRLHKLWQSLRESGDAERVSIYAVKGGRALDLGEQFSARPSTVESADA